MPAEDKSTNSGRTAGLVKRVLLALLSALVLLIALVLIWPQSLRPLAEHLIAPQGHQAEIGGLDLSFFPPSATLRDLKIIPGKSGTLSVSLAEAHLQPAIGDGRWLGLVRARGLKVRIASADAPSDSTESPEPGPAVPDLSPLAWLLKAGQLQLTDAELVFEQDGQRLAVIGLTIRLENGKLSGGCDLAFHGPGGAKRGNGRIELNGRFTDQAALALEMDASMQGLEAPGFKGGVRARISAVLKPGGLAMESINLTSPEIKLAVQASAHADFAAQSLEVLIRKASLLGAVQAQGRLMGRAHKGWEGSINGHVDDPALLFRRMAALLPSGFTLPAVKGRIPMRAALTPTDKGHTIEVAVLLSGLSLGHKPPGLALGGEVNLKGPLAGPHALSGRISAEGRFSAGPLEMKSMRAELGLAGHLTRPRLIKPRLKVAPGGLVWRGRPLGPVELALEAEALTPRGEAFSLDGFSISVDQAVLLSGRAMLGPSGLEARLGGKGIKLAALLQPLMAVAGRDHAGWTAGGTAELDLTAEGPLETLAFQGRLKLTQAAVASPDGTIMAQDLGGELAFHGGLAPNAPAGLTLDMSQGEALWTTIYLNLTKSPLLIKARAASAGVEGVSGAEVGVSLKGYGEFKVTGGLDASGSAPAYQGELSARGVNMGPVFRTFVRDPLAESHPALEESRAGGKADLRLRIGGKGQQARLSGRLILSGLGLSLPATKSSIESLDLDLPFSYHLGAAPKPLPASRAKWGRLRLSGLKAGGVELARHETALALIPNRLLVKGDLVMPVLGGRVRITGLKVDRPLSGDFRATMGVQMTRLDLAQAAGPSLPLKGRMSGHFDGVVVDVNQVTGQGGLTGRVFGGLITVSNVGMRHPFAPNRQISADVNFTKVDLYQLSSALGIGLITGRVNGSLRKFSVAYGQPVSFDLRMRSFKTEGVEQMVSLKAVNSIAVLGTGTGLTGAGVSLVTAIMSQFPYEAIGFECALRNDVFRIRGLIRDGGVEYLVKKPPLIGINVINRNPDNTISFSDMVERLKRVVAPRNE